jgi:hypothetical protein
MGESAQLLIEKQKAESHDTETYQVCFFFFLIPAENSNLRLASNKVISHYVIVSSYGFSM